MDASLFISRKLRFKGKIAMVCIAVSFLVMIIAVSVSSGYRREIRSGLSAISGDVQITPPDMNILDEGHPIEADPSYLPQVSAIDAVKDVVPVIYRAGIVKHGDNMHGVLLKGLPEGVQPDTVSLGVSIPSRLASESGLKVGDRMLTYFIGERLKVRQFNVASVYDSMVETDGRHIVYASMADLQRLNGWEDDQASALEIHLKEGYADEESIRMANEEIGFTVNAYSSEDEETVIATSTVSRFPQLFGWLDLIDFNVLFILVLMTIVAGFNMISGLLIMLFEHISTIGLLKALGMTDRSISKVFLSSSAVLVAKGMLWGNALALLFCIIQQKTHILKLDPENYYVSFVPVNVDFGLILSADLISFAVIMLLLLIPCMFIARVDPAETVRVK
ncbi:MAG: ABC transporter permease [Bacteroidales bacterium]|nr:ABC transporter permease [Bacteroidales bacterium]